MTARRGRSRAQATLEFAFVAPLFLLCFLAAIDAALWAIQTSASVSAAEQSVRLAAAAAGTPSSETTPTAATLLRAVRGQLQQALFGTSVVAWCEPGAPSCVSTAAGSPFPSCPRSPADVEARFGPRTVAVCDETSAPAPACAAPPAPPTPRCGDPPVVTVEVVGYLASLVPPLEGLGWHAGEIPLLIVATSHTLRFSP